jgi:hypothetical protein
VCDEVRHLVEDVITRHCVTLRDEGVKTLASPGELGDNFLDRIKPPLSL